MHLKGLSTIAMVFGLLLVGYIGFRWTALNTDFLRSRRFRNVEHGFSIAAPGKPKVDPISFQTSSGTKLRGHLFFFFDTPPRCVYVVETYWAEGAPNALTMDKELQDRVRLALSGHQPERSTEELGGYIGKHELEGESYYARGFVLDPARLFVLIVGGEGCTKEHAAEYFASFEPLPP